MKLLIIASFAALLAACGKPDAVDAQAKNAAGLPTLNQPQPSPTGKRPVGASKPLSNRAVVRVLPIALQGRWGLTPRDCMSGLGDAKGLLVINSTELRFYESRAVPAADVETSADSISGQFNFTGEGQSWSRYESLEAKGDKMIRTERNPLASFSYARCT
jgi:hypothetical protein